MARQAARISHETTAHGIAVGPGGAVTVIGTIGGDATFQETTLIGADDVFVWRMAR